MYQSWTVTFIVTDQKVTGNRIENRIKFGLMKAGWFLWKLCLATIPADSTKAGMEYL